MEHLHVHQSLPICIALASLGGILEVAATAITALPSVIEQQRGYPVSSLVRWLAIVANIFLQMVGGLLSALLATWFGPISIVVPFFYCATLLSNMIIFGIFLGETFRKSMRVGTHVIVLAVILLPVVGPTVSPEQTFDILLEHWYSIPWLCLLLLTTLVTGVVLIVHASPSNTDPETNKFLRDYTPMQRTVVLLLCRAATMSIDLTVSRCLVLGPPTKFIVTGLIVTKLFSGNLYTYAIVVQSYSVEQAQFVPLNATMVILVNALTGLLVWEDQPQSWYGYICVFWLLGIGCDLLLSVPLLHSENPDFGTTKSANVILTEGMTPIRKLTGDVEEIKKLLSDSKDGESDNADTPKRRGAGYQSITHGNETSADKSGPALKTPDSHHLYDVDSMNSHTPSSLQQQAADLTIISKQLNYINDGDTDTSGSEGNIKKAISPLTPRTPAVASSPLDLFLRTVGTTSPVSHASNSTTMSRREAWSEVISPNKSQKRRRTGSGGGNHPEASFFPTREVRQPRIPSPIPPHGGLHVPSVPLPPASSSTAAAAAAAAQPPPPLLANSRFGDDALALETPSSSSLTSVGEWSNRGLTSWDEGEMNSGHHHFHPSYVRNFRTPSPLLGSDISQGDDTASC